MKRRAIFFLVVFIFFLSVIPAAATIMEYTYTAEFNPSDIYLGTADTATATVKLTVTEENPHLLTIIDPWPTPFAYVTSYYSEPITSLTLEGTDYDGTYFGGIDSIFGSVQFYEMTDAVTPDSTVIQLYYEIPTGVLDFRGIVEYESGYFPDVWPDALPLFPISESDISGYAGVIDRFGDPAFVGRTSWSTAAVASSAPVPEPATMLLLGTGLIGLAGWGRKKLKK